MSKALIKQIVEDVKDGKMSADDADIAVLSILPDKYTKYLTELIFPIRQYGLNRSYSAIRRMVLALSNDEYSEIYKQASSATRKSARNELSLFRMDLSSNNNELIISLSSAQIEDHLSGGLLHKPGIDFVRYLQLMINVMGQYAGRHDESRATEALDKIALIKSFADTSVANKNKIISLSDSIEFLETLSRTRVDLETGFNSQKNNLWQLANREILSGIRAGLFGESFPAYVLSTPALRRSDLWHYCESSPVDINRVDADYNTFPLEHFVSQIEIQPAEATEAFPPLETYDDMVRLGLDAQSLNNNLKSIKKVVGDHISSGHFFSVFRRSIREDEKMLGIYKPILEKLVNDGFAGMVPNPHYAKFNELNIVQSEPILQETLRKRISAIARDPENFAGKTFWRAFTRALTISLSDKGVTALKFFAEILADAGVIEMPKPFNAPKFYDAVCNSEIAHSHRLEKSISSHNLLLYAVDSQNERLVKSLLEYGHSPDRLVEPDRDDFDRFIQTMAKKGTNEGSRAFSQFIERERWSGGSLTSSSAVVQPQKLLRYYAEFCADRESPDFRKKYSDNFIPSYFKILDLLLPEPGTVLGVELSALMSASPHLHQMALDKGLSLRLIHNDEFKGRIGPMWLPENRGASSAKIARNLVQMYQAQKAFGISPDTQSKNGETVLKAFITAGGDEVTALFNRERIGRPDTLDIPKKRTRMMI